MVTYFLIIAGTYVQKSQWVNTDAWNKTMTTKTMQILLFLGVQEHLIYYVAVVVFCRLS